MRRGTGSFVRLSRDDLATGPGRRRWEDQTGRRIDRAVVGTGAGIGADALEEVDRTLIRRGDSRRRGGDSNNPSRPPSGSELVLMRRNGPGPSSPTGRTAHPSWGIPT